MAGLGDPSEAAVRLRVPVVRATCDNLAVVVPTVIQLSALSRSWEPAQLRFVLSAGGAKNPAAEWQVDAADIDTAMSVATNLATIANAVLADIRGEPQEAGPTSNAVTVPEPREPDAQAGDDAAEPEVEPAVVAVADFVASRQARVDYVRGISSAWRVAREDSVRWQLTVDLDALLSPPAEEHSAAADDKIMYPETPTPTEPSGERLVGARIRLVSFGESRVAAAITALFSEDTMGPYGLQSLPVTGPSAPLTWLPMELAAHLLAGPARMPSAFRPILLPGRAVCDVREGGDAARADHRRQRPGQDGLPVALGAPGVRGRRGARRRRRARWVAGAAGDGF